MLRSGGNISLWGTGMFRAWSNTQGIGKLHHYLGFCKDVVKKSGGQGDGMFEIVPIRNHTTLNWSVGSNYQLLCLQYIALMAQSSKGNNFNTRVAVCFYFNLMPMDSSPSAHGGHHTIFHWDVAHGTLRLFGWYVIHELHEGYF